MAPFLWQRWCVHCFGRWPCLLLSVVECRGCLSILAMGHGSGLGWVSLSLPVICSAGTVVSLSSSRKDRGRWTYFRKLCPLKILNIFDELSLRKVILWRLTAVKPNQKNNIPESIRNPTSSRGGLISSFWPNMDRSRTPIFLAVYFSRRTIQAGLPIDDNCLFERNEPFSEVKFKISNM